MTCSITYTVFSTLISSERRLRPTLRSQPLRIPLPATLDRLQNCSPDAGRELARLHVEYEDVQNHLTSTSK